MKPTAHLIAILIIALVAQVGHAGDRGQNGKQGHGGGGMSASQAAAQAQRQTGGKVLGVRKSDGGFRVKVLIRGQTVESVWIPAGR